VPSTVLLGLVVAPVVLGLDRRAATEARELLPW
jgi:hypothetical protein